MERMETYVNQVCDIQALDAVPVRKEPISLPAFLDRQKAKYTMLVGAHDFRFECCCGELPTPLELLFLIVKAFLRKQQEQYVSDLKKELQKG